MADGIELEGVCFAWRKGAPVLVDLDLCLEAGSFTAIIGPNGSGKSTLMQVLAGLIRPDLGSVRAGGLDLGQTNARERARSIAYLPQSENEDVPFNALELVLMGRFPYQGLLPFDRLEDLQTARLCLDQVGAGDLAGRLMREMSGGERQRVHLARALAQDPSILLLDEPASSLDLRYQVEVYRLLKCLNRDQGRTIVVVSHDLNLPADHADRVAVLHGGRISSIGPPREILRAEILEPVYGTRILEATSPHRDLPYLHPAP